jgi:hypothetical protein
MLTTSESARLREREIDTERDRERENHLETNQHTFSVREPSSGSYYYRTKRLQKPGTTRTLQLLRTYYHNSQISPPRSDGEGVLGIPLLPWAAVCTRRPCRSCALRTCTYEGPLCGDIKCRDGGTVSEGDSEHSS